MFSITVTDEFCASHQLRLPGGVLEPLHGHNFRVTVQIDSPMLDGMDTVMDFHVLAARLAAVLAPWRNGHLNDLPPFADAINPSAERIAEQVGRLLQPALSPPARLARVQVTEAAGCAAAWSPE